MGWSSGSRLMEEIIVSAMKHVPDSARSKFYREIIEHFEDMDCDTLYECEGIDRYFDSALEYFHPKDE